MEWAELDFDKAQWTIPAAKMKCTKQAKIDRHPHYVPLSVQAVASLERLRPLTGHHHYVFPSVLCKGQCMGEIHREHRLALYGLRQRDDDGTRVSGNGAHVDRGKPERRTRCNLSAASPRQERPAGNGL